VSDYAIIVTCTVFAVAGFVQGLSGFGFGIVAMAILPLALNDMQTAFSITALNSLIIPILTFVRLRHAFKLADALPMTIAAIGGALLGFAFADYLIGETIFLRILGATLIVFAAADVILTSALKTHMPKWMAWPCGLVGGFFGGAFNTGGPPMVAFCYSQPWTKHQIVATLQFAFLIATSARVALMAGTGKYFDKQVLMLTLSTVIPIAIGIYFGGQLLARIPLQKLRIGVFAIVVLLGLQYLLFPNVGSR
jgi:uncharacterized membrane protein YfcA